MASLARNGSSPNLIKKGGSEQTSPNLSQNLRALVDKAIDGKLTSQDYKGEFAGYLKETNEKMLSLHNVTMDKTLLTSEAQVPVVDPQQSESTRWGSDTLTLTNNGKKSIYFQVRQKNIDKYQLEAIPFQGKLRKGESKKIELKFRAFCTSKFYQLMQISLALKKEELSVGTMKKKGLFMSGKSEAPVRPAASIDDSLGRSSLVFCLRIESELSAFLDYDEVTLGDKIAGGAFGTVHKALWRDSEVAVKVLHNAESMMPEERDLVKREIALMSKLSFPYIVTYMGSTAAVASQPLCMVMEYIRGGSLTHLIQKPDFSFRMKVKVSLDVAKGMAYLHSHNIYHRDLKPDNFLVISQHDDVDVNLKITDFGTSRSNKRSKEDLQRVYGIEDSPAVASSSEFTPAAQQVDLPDQKKNERNLTNGVGTLIYQAPETLGGQTDYNIEKTDLYSFGVSLLHIFTGVEPYSVDPYDKFGVWDIINFVTRGDRLDTSVIEDYRVRNMIHNCWQDKPDKRPKFSQVAKDLVEILNSPGPMQEPTSSPNIQKMKQGGRPASSLNLYAMNPGGTTSLPNSGGNMNNSSANNLQVSGTGAGGASPRKGTEVGASTSSPDLTPLQISSNAVPTSSDGMTPRKVVPTPSGSEHICWCGAISRQEAEAKLLRPDISPGTFLTRWSDTMGSYVLSYKKSTGGIEHIAHIRPVAGDKINVGKSDGTVSTYDNLLSYIGTLREERVVSMPFEEFTAATGNLYTFGK